MIRLNHKIGEIVRILPLFLFVCCLCSCDTVRYVPVESVRTDSVYVERHHRDSVLIRDSIFVLMKGDTVYRDRYRLVYRDRFVRDTIRVNHTDTVRIPYPVEKQLTGWQRVKMDIGGVLLAVVGVLILIGFGKMVYKLKK